MTAPAARSWPSFSQLRLQLPLWRPRCRWQIELCQCVGDDDVPSHASVVLPWNQYKPVRLLSSDPRRPNGSLVVGMFAVDRPRQTRSLRLWCRVAKPLPPLHESPWTPLASTSAPHGPVAAICVGDGGRAPKARVSSAVGARIEAPKAPRGA